MVKFKQVQPRLLAIDIDGTLLNSSYQLPEENLKALHRAHRAGVEVVLATGRRHGFALSIAQQLGFDLWLISSNGAITRSLAGEYFHRDFLPLAAARQICACTTDFRGHMVITFDTEQKGALVLEHLEVLSGSIRRWLEKNSEYIDFVRPIENALKADPVQAMFCGPIERMRQLEKLLGSSPVLSAVTMLKTEYQARDLCILDILNRECSKGHALRRWAKFRGFEPAQVAAIGDNHNDAEMLNYAGLPFIMANACEELRQNGWSLAPSNDECGVAAVIEKVLG
jgi:Cof subfamily protein (haloacid dehalogenase superfamily)